jgi:hypothetical protein
VRKALRVGHNKSDVGKKSPCIDSLNSVAGVRVVFWLETDMPTAASCLLRGAWPVAQRLVNSQEGRKPIFPLNFFQKEARPEKKPVINLDSSRITDQDKK